jgi:hypothetical protein
MTAPQPQRPEPRPVEWFRRCPNGGGTVHLSPQPSTEDTVTDTDELAARIAAVLREHSRTTGMAVTMGWTCRCGHWASGKNGDMPSNHQAAKIAELFQQDKPRPLSPVEIEPWPQAGDRVRGTDLDGVVRVGKLVGFFAWSNETSRNERAHVDLDDGTKAVVHTASLRRLEVRRA